MDDDDDESWLAERFEKQRDDAVLFAILAKIEAAEKANQTIDTRTLAEREADDVEARQKAKESRNPNLWD